MPQFESETAAPPENTRRAREEALIAHMRENAGQWRYVEGGSLYSDLDELYAILEAAHRREDAIREIVHFEVIEPREKILAILERAEASA